MLQSCGYVAQNAGVHSVGFTWQYGDCADADGVPIDRFVVTRATATIRPAITNFNLFVIQPPYHPGPVHPGPWYKSLTDSASRSLPESAPTRVYVANPDCATVLTITYGTQNYR